MIKKNNQWIFAEYIWNNDQTDALLTTASANKNITYTKNGITNNIDYQIPDLVKCVTCHTLDNTITPIGIKPQNLNFDLIYADNTRNQLQKWVDVGYLQSGFAALPDYFLRGFQKNLLMP